MGFSDEPVFLGSGVRFEPLVDRFPAEVLDVAPVPASLRLAGRWAPMLESALQDPAPPGADPSGMEVGALLDAIKRDRADMLAFAAAVSDADHLLRRHDDDGPAARPAGLPSMLDGLAELARDDAGRPLLRFVEPVVYDSPVYDVARQSVRLTLGDADPRPGPRLPAPDALDLAVPFAHPGLDALARARNTPTTAAQLCAALGLDGAEPARLGRLLTTAPPAARDRHLEHGARARYLGHACLMLQTSETTVLVDPSAGFDLAALPDRIDLVLLTHAHRDHTVLATLLQLRPRIGTVVAPRSSRGNRYDPSIGLCLRALGFAVVELDDYDELPVPGGRVVATPYLGEGSGPDVRAKSTYAIQIAGASIFVGGDAGDPTPAGYRHLRRRLGPIHMAFLGMRCGTAADGPAGRDAELIRALDADEVYVFATHAPRDPRLRTQVEQFLDWCRGHGITAEQLVSGRTWRW